MAKTVKNELWIIKAGILPYDDGWRLQRQLRAARSTNRIGDTLLLLQHLPVMTFGRKTNGDSLLVTEEFLRQKGIDTVAVDRGGDITYHGPGQLVGYPIMGLRQCGLTVGTYVRQLEKVVIDSLTDLGIHGMTMPGLIGVWVGKEKIASIGVRVSNGVSTHGFALNVENDLTPFQYIHPCGMDGVKMTSVAEHSRKVFNYGEVEALVVDHFQRLFHRNFCVEDTLSYARVFGA